MISLEEFAIASMGWPREELAKLWQYAVGEKGIYSTAIIAEMLNGEFHNNRTRNAVIGKLQRGGVKLGFTHASDYKHSKNNPDGPRPPPIKKEKSMESFFERSGFQRLLVEQEVEKVTLSDAPGANLPLEGRCGAWEAICHLGPNHCRWPIGETDSDEFHYCCQPVMVNSSYCQYHKMQSAADPRRLRPQAFYRY